MKDYRPLEDGYAKGSSGDLIDESDSASVKLKSDIELQEMNEESEDDKILDESEDSFSVYDYVRYNIIKFNNY